MRKDREKKQEEIMHSKKCIIMQDGKKKEECERTSQSAETLPNSNFWKDDGLYEKQFLK